MKLKLEGRLAGPYVGELDRTWQSLASSLGAKSLVVDLSDVLYVVAAGRRLLAQIHKTSGASFVANSVLTSYFAQEAMQSSHSDGRQGG